MKNEWKQAKIIDVFSLSRDITGLRVVTNTIPPHTPGQFYILKVKLADGSEQSREYSVSNAPSTSDYLEFGIQDIPTGIVSPILCSSHVNDTVEIKGPMGKYFNWNEKHKGPVILIAGGAGIVPFLSMIRSFPSNEIHLIGSFKTIEDIPYRKEIETICDTHSNIQFRYTLTRQNGSSGKNFTGRITPQMLMDIYPNYVNKNVQIFICGRSSFVEDINQMLLECGASQEAIQRERFG